MNAHAIRTFGSGIFTLRFPRSMSSVERFHESYIPEPNSGCWLWIGALGGDYGNIKVNGAKTGSHVYSWKLNKGDIPKGIFVCHKCDTPLCVNPNHLFLGTHKENMKDMRLKARSAKGSRASRSKLNENEVTAIRNDPSSWDVIAKKYGVTRENIRAVKIRLTWTHIP